MAKGMLSAPLVRLPERLTTGREIRSGGEGKIFEVAEAPDLVAKIYHRPPGPERQRKLHLMAQMAVPELRAIAAWPLRTVGAAGKVTGFVMPLVADHKDVHLLYSPKSRRENFPDADFRFVVRTAAAIARAFAVAHAAGVVIGDVNYGGVTVSADGDVKLLDCDSFQIEGADGTVYHCEVGMPEFTPPELLGKPLDRTLRTPNHDNFGLAVLLFRLLMMGRHPFVGRFAGYGEMTQERAMAEFRYAYGPRAEAMRMSPPPGVPPVGAVAGPAAAAAFERAFDAKGPTGTRPEAAVWVGLLEALEGELAACADLPAHWTRGGHPCVWCAVEQASGIAMFPRAEAVEPPAPVPIEVMRAAAVAMAIELPAPETFADPEPEEDRVRFPALAVLAKIAVLLGAAWLLAKTDSGILALLSIWAGIKLVNRGFRRFGRKTHPMREQLLARRAAAEARRAGALRLFGALVDGQVKDFAAARAVVEEARRRLDEIPRQRALRVGAANASRGELQLLAHLRRHRIADARIRGVGPERTRTLASGGIETAADVVPGAVAAMPGFGPTIESALMEWRRKVERSFVYDPRRPPDRADALEARREIDAAQRKCEQDLLRAPDEMRAIVEIMLKRRERAAEAVRQATEEVSAVNRLLNAEAT